MMCAVFVIEIFCIRYAIAISGRVIAMASSSGKGSLVPSTIIGMMTAVKLPASIRIGFLPSVIRIASSPLHASDSPFQESGRQPDVGILSAGCAFQDVACLPGLGLRRGDLHHAIHRFDEGALRAHRIHHADGLHQAGLLHIQMSSCAISRLSDQIHDLLRWEVLRACHCGKSQVFCVIQIGDLEDVAVGSRRAYAYRIAVLHQGG